MKTENHLKGVKPLFYNSHGNLILSKGALVFEKNGDKLAFICELPVTVGEKLLFKSKLLVRLFRYGVMSAAEYDGAYYFAFDKSIYRYDLKKGKLTCDFTFSKGRGPLSFTVIEGIQGFKNGLYFGEYISNASKKPVKIFKRQGEWSVVYEFSDGELNHIHNLVPDHKSQCVWILAGDFDESAAIYKVTGNFEEVDIVLSGSQNYRACVAFPLEGGLIYATDTQQTKNSIRILTQYDGSWKSHHVHDIIGSCIYGQELPDYYVFSTSTEPSEIVESRISGLLDNKPAPAIEKNQSDIMVLSKKSREVKIIYSAEKDIYPYRLFQFGTVMFPQGIPKENEIAAYFVGSKKHDLTTVFFSAHNEF